MIRFRTRRISILGQMGSRYSGQVHCRRGIGWNRDLQRERSVRCSLPITADFPVDRLILSPCRVQAREMRMDHDFLEAGRIASRINTSSVTIHPSNDGTESVMVV